MLAMRLAEACGRVDVDEMLSEITPTQWAEWVARDRIEPIGTFAACSILAKLGELIAACMQCEAKQGDFMPWLKVQEPVEDVREARVLLREAIMKAAGR